MLVEAQVGSLLVAGTCHCWSRRQAAGCRLQSLPALLHFSSFCRCPVFHLIYIARLQARGLFVKGHLPSLGALAGYRVLLAPLRYGAGLKGKVVDAWTHGLPVRGCQLYSLYVHSSSIGKVGSAPAKPLWI